MEEQLNLEFLWLPKEEELSDLNSVLANWSERNPRPSGPLLKLKTCLRNFCGFPVFLKDCKKRIELADFSTNEAKNSKTENALFYLEFIFNVCCAVHLEKNPQDDFRRFIDLFCSTEHDRLAADIYLKFDPAIFPFDTEQIKTVESAISLKKFSLGNFVGLNTFHERFDSKSALQENDYKITQVRLQMLHDYKRMLLYFVVGKIVHVKKRNSSTHLLHKMEILYSSLHSIVVSKRQGLVVYFRFLVPPLLYSIVQEMDADEVYTSFFEVGPRTPWFRSIDPFKDSPTYLRKEFSMNTVLCLEFKTDDYDFLFKLMTHCKSIQLFFAPVVVRKPLESPARFSPKLDDFECFYALQCLLSHSFELVDQLYDKKDAELVQKFLQDASKSNPQALSEALYLIFEASIKGNVLKFKHSVQYLYEKLKSKAPRAVTDSFSEKEKKENLGHLLLIKRAILTPTHLVLLPPQPTLKSRALRDCNPSYSLRVSLRDVNMDTINFSLKGFGANKIERQHKFYNDFFKTQLLKGFNLHKRLYKYVGSSTSQLKGHGMWFYARDDRMRTADTLRAEFGQLEKIKEVPRYMARMGQTFSQSMGFIKVPQEWTNVNDPEPDVTGGVKKYLVIKDVKSESKNKFLKREILDSEDGDSEEEDDTEPYTFSDGIGRISLELAEEIYKALDVEEESPCAMQIRYAGCKGMLLVDPRLEGKKILFRKSMVKFKSNHDSLEILKFSEKRSAFLNRPFITILEGLGVNKEMFLKLQKEMIQNHITAMFHESKACQFLYRHSLLRFNFLSMFAAGIRFTEDPLFRSMIFALFQKQIELLKNKANVEIPVNQGRNMFGVMDETFTLEYGQVFVQYTDWETDERIIHTGTVVVTKNPCMHPGDVRKFEAVDVKDLHHVVDCIAFPAKGPRPHPDEMAGSDLDGDEYHVMWCEELTFPYDNAAPMHFAQRKEKATVKNTKKDSNDTVQNGVIENVVENYEDFKCPVQISDELTHFGKFIFSDIVGIVASAHLAWADQLKQGINSDICIRLAGRYSMALDFAKTGVSVSLGQERVIKYPDFMQKLDQKRTYLSTRALGILYRSCKRLELGLETERNEIEYKIDPALVHEKWADKYKQSARRVLNRYCDRIEYFIRTYGFENEGQLLGGALINPPKYYENRHDMSNLMALLEFEVQWIFKDLERKFFEEFGGKPKNEVFTDLMMQKASAWYMVTYNKDEDKGGSRFFGLPWAVSDVLVQLKNRNATSERRHNLPSKSLLESIVDKSISKHYPNLTPDSETSVIYSNRLQILDTALKVLMKWVKSQREYFSEPDFAVISKCISREFESQTMAIATCSEGFIDVLKSRGDIKQAISPCYHVIKTMLHVAEMGTQASQQRLSDVRQELGLLAWITLIKLACTYNPQYLGIPNEAGVYAETIFYTPQDNIIDTLQLPLFEKNNEANLKFSELLTHNFKYIERYLKKQTRLKSIDFRIVPGSDNTSFVRFTVVGTRYSIERLKDIVVLEDFFYAAVENRPLSY